MDRASRGASTTNKEKWRNKPMMTMGMNRARSNQLGSLLPRYPFPEVGGIKNRRQMRASVKLEALQAHARILEKQVQPQKGRRK